MSLPLALLLAEATVAWPVTPPPVADHCDTAPAPSAPMASRLVTARDLATLTDVGRSDPYESPSPFGLSPDGHTLAFLLRQADPDDNAFCQRLVTIPVTPGHPMEKAPRVLDSGGTFIRASYRLRSFPAVRAGYGQVITPHWSPDGREIAFLKQTLGPPQAWIAPLDGSPAHAVTDLPDAVEDLAWTRDGLGLVIATRPALRKQSQAIAAQAREGYLFDDRFSPELAAHPIASAPMPLVYSRVDRATGETRPASPMEQALLSPPRAPQQPPGAYAARQGPHGAWAWIEPVHPERLISPGQVVVDRPGLPRQVCAATTCEGTSRLWWSGDGRTVYLLQRTGWGRSRTRLLRWPAGASAPRPILATDDVLVGCEQRTNRLICARESSAHPRILTEIDLKSGHARTLYDPNPQWAQFRLGQIRRLYLRNAYGVESHADLVLPPDHRPGERHPLVVVQYMSEGFLRGGTGDEDPIQPLAARGFAVLSFARPDDVPSVLEAHDENEFMRRQREGWLDRRSIQSSLEEALRLAGATGTVDPDRMGITGFSEGSSMTQWALVNSKLFKVAELGVCCEGPTIFPLAAGPVFEELGRKIGNAWFLPDSAKVWAPMDLAANAERIDAPILVQSGDSEYTGGLDVIARFRLLARPIELWIMPDEPHFKWQPAHRLAMYERTLDWFSFWLQHKRDCTPGKDAQYDRWLAMRGAPARQNLVCLPSSP